MLYFLLLLLIKVSVKHVVASAHAQLFPLVITVGNTFPLVLTAGNRFSLVITVGNTFPLVITVGNAFPPLITVRNMFLLVITVGNTFPLVITVGNTFPLVITVENMFPSLITVGNTLPLVITVRKTFLLVITVRNKFLLVITVENTFLLLTTVRKNNGSSFFLKKHVTSEMSSMGHGSFVKTEILFRNFVPRQLLVTWGFPALCFGLLMTCCLLQNFFFWGGRWQLSSNSLFRRLKCVIFWRLKYVILGKLQ